MVAWRILENVGFKNFFKVGIESSCVWYKTLFLSLYVLLWEVVENLYKGARVSLCVAA